MDDLGLEKNRCAEVVEGFDKSREGFAMVLAIGYL
jgi:hypothetical protein